MFSPTGYYAHYPTRFRDADGSPGNSWTDTFPVVGYTDVALVIDVDGSVKTVEALRETLAEGGDKPDEEGQTWTVGLEVNTFADGA
jgi:hypothetical protein